MRPRTIGRSSSHFTRVARVFALELEVAHDFAPVLDLFSRQPADYGDHPALKLPVLVTDEGPWFGALASCRELARRADATTRIVWPEQLAGRIASNAQELVLQGMATEVGLLMRSVGAAPGALPYDDKARESLANSLAWLDAHLAAALDTLAPRRALSFFEVTTYCFLTHLPFREVLDPSGYANLSAFTRAYGERPSLRATTYHFDAS